MKLRTQMFKGPWTEILRNIWWWTENGKLILYKLIQNISQFGIQAKYASSKQSSTLWNLNPYRCDYQKDKVVLRFFITWVRYRPSSRYQGLGRTLYIGFQTTGTSPFNLPLRNGLHCHWSPNISFYNFQTNVTDKGVKYVSTIYTLRI